MAEQEKAKKRIRKTETMRDKSTKDTTKGSKTRRLKQTASVAARPFKAAKKVAKKEYFVVKPHETGYKAFFTKSRKWTPGYFRSAYKELRLVTWPSRKETWKLVTAVFVFSVAFGLVITIVDYGLEKLFRKAFL
jgi:preprotein translocase subunit SecE